MVQLRTILTKTLHNRKLITVEAYRRLTKAAFKTFEIETWFPLFYTKDKFGHLESDGQRLFHVIM